MHSDYSFIPELCLSMPGAIEEYKASWDAVLYRVRGRIFVLVGEDGRGNPCMSIKSSRDEVAPLYDRYDALSPGYHMNKRHWTTLRLDCDCPVEVVAHLIRRSYELVVAGLPKREQAALRMETRGQ